MKTMAKTLAILALLVSSGIAGRNNQVTSTADVQMELQVYAQAFAADYAMFLLSYPPQQATVLASAAAWQQVLQFEQVNNLRWVVI